MNKSLLVFCTLVLALQSFTIEQEITPSVQGIPWPFNPCGTGDWTIEALTLSQTPVRNINDDIDVVKLFLFSLELPTLIPLSPLLTSTSS
jgi:hypothetical protein